MLVDSYFIVATIMHANRVRSRQGLDESSEARRVFVCCNRTRLGSGVSVGRRTIRVRGDPDGIALAPKDNILYCVAFVDRGEVRRIISLRRANRREVKHYVENL